MAIQGRFEADFSDFQRAAQAATLQLRSFETGSEKVEKQLNRMGDAFSGRKILQEAVLATKAVEDIGGASKLTESEQRRLNATLTEALSKYKALGMEAPKAMTELAESTKKPTTAFGLLETAVGKLGAALVATFTVGAIVSAIKGTGEWAGRIDDLSKKLGISTGDVQRFSFAAKQHGSSIDQVGIAITQLSKNITEGDGAAIPALRRLNLSFEELRTLSPEHAFRTVARAIGELTDKNEQLTTAQQLLGRSGSDLIPMFATMDADMRKAVVASDDLIKAGDQIGDSWDALVGVGKSLLVGVLAPMGPSMESAARAASRFAQSQLDLAEATRQANTLLAAQGKLPIAIERQLDPSGTQKLIQQELDVLTMTRMLEQARTSEAAKGGIGSKAGDPLARLGLPSESDIRKLEKASDDITAKHVKAAAAALQLREAWAAMVQKSVELTTTTQQLALGTVRVFDATGNWINQLRGNMPAAIVSASASIEGRLIPAVQGVNDLLMKVKPGDIWSQNISQGVEAATRSFGTFGDIVADGFDKMFVGAISFKDGFLDIWKSLQAGVSNILTAILNDFTGRFLKGILAASSGKAFSGAFAGMLGGAGAGAAGAGAGGAGTAAAVGGGIGAGTLIAATGGIAAAAILAWAIYKKGLFRGGEEGTKVNPARDEFIGASGGLDVLNKKAVEAGTSLDKLLSAKKVKDFEAEVARLNATLGNFAADQEADAQRLVAAYEKYNIAFQDRAPVDRQRDMNAGAKELIEDWRVLTDAYKDTVPVNEKMAAAINDYLKLARQVGSEVPPEMKKVIDSLFKQGLLTDDAGVAITDLEAAGIHFAESWTAGFEKVVKKLDELIAKMVAAGTAIAGLPTDIKIPGTSVDAGDLNQGGGDWNGMGFAGGTRGRYLNFGAGTPVMLHGKERVMTEGEGGTDTGLLTAFHVLSAQIIQAMTTTALMARDQSMLARGRGASYA